MIHASSPPTPNACPPKRPPAVDTTGLSRRCEENVTDPEQTFEEARSQLSGYPSTVSEPPRYTPDSAPGGESDLPDR